MDFSGIQEGCEDPNGQKDGQNYGGSGEEKLVFHYSREERLKNAPELVKKYYFGELLTTKRGLFRVLFSTKGNRMMFFALVAAVAVVFFLGFFGPAKNESLISGIPASVSAFSIEDTVYTSLKLEKPSKKKDVNFDSPCQVSAVFYAYDADNQQLFSENLSELYKDDEMFLRTTFTDYDIFNIAVDVKIGDEEKRLSCRVEKH